MSCICDEGIPTSLPSSVDDIAGRVDVQHKPNDLCTGPITRARAKLLEQQVNSLLTEYNLFTNENFILPKSLLDVLMFSINPMIYVLDQLQEHVPSYWNNR
jgi:hypothetical protein